jgi:hypothetical protein
VFPEMKNGRRENSISFSINKAFVKVLKGTHTARGNYRDIPRL